MEAITEQQPKSDVPSSPYMTDRETAAYLRLSPKFGHITVQRWARLGLLKAGKVGDHWVFRKHDVDDFVFSKTR